jgi:hypothetical protein
MATLAEIRARIKAQEDTKQNKPAARNTEDSVYRHWDIPEGSSASIRFLPDADTNNPDIWLERNLIKLPFNGVLGRPDIKRVEVQIPCLDMWQDKTCPIIAELRTWYKDESLKELANKYWKKRSYLYQGFVRVNPLEDDRPGANPIRRIIISPQLQTIIRASIMDPEVLELPTHYLKGLDFNIRKTAKGDYADYSTSSFARRESALTDEEQMAIEQHGLFDLKSFLPKRPDDAALKVIMEMFNASVDGQAYDLERWGSFYKPWGLGGNDENSTESAQSAPKAAAPKASPAVSDSTPPWEDEAPVASKVVVPPAKPAAPAVSSDKANDILAMIRARQGKPA